MIVGKKYKIKDSDVFDFTDHNPNGTIVKCEKAHGHNWYSMSLIDACGRQLREGISGWLINTDTIYYDEI
jgi:hypothetical protein